MVPESDFLLENKEHASLTHGDVTSPIILSEEDKASLEAARAGLTAVRQVGGDKLSEKLLLTRIDELERKKRQSQNPSAIYLRTQTTERMEKIEEQRKARENRIHEVTLERLKIKKMEAENAKAKI